MMNSSRALLTSAYFLLFAPACMPGNYTRSVNGTLGGYSLANAHPKPLSLLVARKLMRPLYIVLDPSKVKDMWQMATARCATGTFGCEHFNVTEMQLFVKRDLKTAMENYFTTVTVVESAEALPKTAHIVADVKIDDLKLNSLVRGPLTFALIQMNWGFALRESEKDDYMYSFAGEATSNDSYPSFEAGLATMVENAIPAMLKKWTEGGGLEALRAADRK